MQPIKANEISLDEASSTFPLFPAGKSGPDSSRKWRCLVKACLDFQERRRRHSLSRFLSRYHIAATRFIRDSIFDFGTLNFPQDRFVTMTISLRHEFLEKYGSPLFSCTVFESYLEYYFLFLWRSGSDLWKAIAMCHERSLSEFSWQYTIVYTKYHSAHVAFLPRNIRIFNFRVFFLLSLILWQRPLEKSCDFSRLKFRIVLVIYGCRFELLSYIVFPTRWILPRYESFLFPSSTFVSFFLFLQSCDSNLWKRVAICRD